MTVDWAKCARLHDLAAARFNAGIPPTEDDRRWFHRTQRTNRGWPRIYRVRDSLATDHHLFGIGMLEPAKCLSIVRRDEWWLAIVLKDKEGFGPIIDSDGYARLRLQFVPGIPWRNDAQWGLQ